MGYPRAGYGLDAPLEQEGAEEHQGNRRDLIFGSPIWLERVPPGPGNTSHIGGKECEVE